MSVVINTNSAATIASNNLSASNAMLQRSLNRLSSGSKIVNASDDAGGVAVASRLSAAAKRSGVAGSNIANAVSFLQNEDSALKTMGKMLERMSELKSLYKDNTKNSTDLGNYTTEFGKLKTEFDVVKETKFNGISLFGASAIQVNVDDNVGAYALNSGSIDATAGYGIGDSSGSGNYTKTGSAAYITATAAGYLVVNGQQIAVGTGDTVDNVATRINNNGNTKVMATVTSGVLKLTANTAGTGTSETLSGVDLTGSGAAAFTATGLSATTAVVGADNNVTAAIQTIAARRASNGADQSVLGYYSELTASTKANYESAVSKIMDVDVAEESTQLARWNTLVQAGTAMVAQANGTTQNVLTLLRG